MGLKERLGKMLCALGLHDFSHRVTVQGKSYYACTRCKKLR